MKKILLLSIFSLICMFQSKAAVETINSGSYIINMGILPQTVANGLKPYGLIYDLIKNNRVPIKWVINQSKLKDGIDFSFGGVDYRGGTFIIPAEYRTAAVNAKILSYGVSGNTTSSALSVDVTMTLKSVPSWTLDVAKGSVAQPIFTNAGIPTTAYNWKLPSTLGACDDIFVMPHADPTWATHGNLYNWVRTQQGSVWAGCHAVSVLENMNNGTVQTNFLATNVGAIGNALVPYGSHVQGTPPYIHQNPTSFAAQYMGITDAAHQNGSEQIYLPKLGGGWRPSTEIITYDASQANVPSLSPGPAAVVAYGRAYGDNSMGWVLYQGGHTIAGTTTAQIAAQRVFLNFSFRASGDKTPAVSAISVPTPITTTTAVSISATSPTGSTLSYQWTSSCGGTFASSTSASTTFTPPTVSVSTPCILNCVVTDACGRVSFESVPVIINPGNRAPVATADTKSTPCFVSSLSTNVLTNDSDPDGNAISFSSFTPSSGITTGGTFTHTGSGNVTFAPNPGFVGSQAITYTITDGSLTSSNTVTFTIGNPANAPTAVADTIQTGKNIIRLRKNVKANDTDPLGLSNSIISISVLPTKGSVSVNLDGSIDYLPSLDATGTDSFTYQILNAERLTSTAKVIINISTDVCASGQYQSPSGSAVVNSSLTNIGDTYISEKTAEVGRNYGSCTSILVDGQGTGKIYRGLLNFDHSGIPVGAVIDSAKLTLNCSALVSASNVGVYKMLTSWTEGASCDATGTPNWTTLGASTHFDTTTIAVQNITATGSYSWNVKTQVQRWINKLDSNYGFLIKFPTEGGSNELKTFDSKESSIVANRPKLIISYTPSPVCTAIPNRAPLANPDFGTTVNGTLVTIPTATNDIDVAGTKTYSVVTAASGTTSIDAGTGVISYTPTTTFNGIRTITYRVVNGTTGLADTATVYVTVTDKPLDAINDTATPGDSSNTVQTINVMTNDADMEFAAVSNANGHTVSVYTAPKNGSATVNASGNIVYTPVANFTGRDTLIYQVCEPSPTCGSSFCDTARLYITVLNKKPIIVDDTFNMAICVPKTFNLLANDSDPESNQLSVSSLSAVSPLAAGTITNNGDGTVTFSPTGAYTGTATITYTITDNGVPTQTSNTGTITINVSTPVNNKPVAMDDYTDTLAFGASDIYSVLDNDSDPDGNELSLPTIIKAPSHGTASVLSNGLITYTASNNYIGKDTIIYQIYDIINPGVCTPTIGLYDTAYIFLNTTAPNSVYAINDENATRDYFDVEGNVVYNDFDPQGDSIIFKGFIDSLGNAITSGTITVSGYTRLGVFDTSVGTLTIYPNGNYTFLPDTTFVGVMIVPYAIADVKTAVDTAELRITVSPLTVVGTTLLAQNDENRSYGAPVSSNVTVNDKDPVSVHTFGVTSFTYDTDGDGTADASGTLSSVTTIAGIDIWGNAVTNAGTITLSSTGAYTFTPATNFYGQVVVPYTITCSGGVSTSATLTIDILPDANGPANDPPFAGDDFAMTKVGTSVSGSFVANDNDPNGNSLSYGGTTIVPGGTKTAIGSAVSTHAGGTVQFYTDGTYTYTPPTTFAGPDYVNYSICDVTVVSPQPLCSQALIHFVVDNESIPPTPPVANNISAPSINNSAVTTSIPSLQASSAIGTPIDSFFVLTVPNTATQGTLYYCATPGPGCTKTAVTAGMKLTNAQSKSLFFDPLASFTGSVTFTYNVKDTNGLVSNTANYTIPVFNNPPVTLNVTASSLANSSGTVSIPSLMGADADGSVSSYTVFNIPSSSQGVLYYCITPGAGCTTTAITSATTLTPAQIHTLKFDPDASFSGTYAYKYIATDNNGNVSDSSQYTIPVFTFSGYLPGNMPPVASNISAQSINSSAGATAIPNLLATDPDGKIASYKIGSSVPNTSTEGSLTYCTTPPATGCGTAVTAGMTLTPAQAATLSFDPVAGFTGWLSFTYTATDNYGTPATSMPATYQIPVVNNPPVANPDRVPPVLLTSTTPTPLPPLTGSDYDGTVVSYKINSVPPLHDGILLYCPSVPGTPCASIASYDTISGPISGLTPAQVATFKFLPDGFAGDYVFTFSTIDNNGLESLPASITVPIVVSSTITGVPPMANSYSSSPISSSTTASLSSAFVSSDADGTVDSIVVSSITSASQGILKYCVTPGLSCTEIPITVGLALTPAQLASVVFVPNADFVGTSTFTYTVKDNNGNLGNTATITIPVYNSPPSAVNITNPPVIRLATPTILNSLSASDVDGTIASYTIQTLPAPSEGILKVCTTAPSTGCTDVAVGDVLTPAQVSNLTFTPNVTGSSPVVTFLYYATDNSGNKSNMATSSISVFNPLISKPLATNIDPEINSSAGRTLISPLVASSPTNVPMDTFYVLTLPPASQGVLYYCTTAPTTCALASLTPVSTSTPLTFEQSRALYFDPAPDYMGDVIFTYNAKDSNGLLTNTASYVLPIVNFPPTTVNMSTAQLNDTTTLIQIPELVAGDKDGSIVSYTLSGVTNVGATLKYCSSLDSPCTSLGTIIGSITLTPAQMRTLAVEADSGFSGNYTFNYTATDNNGNVSNTSTYTIPVVAFSSMGGNLPPVATNVTSQSISNNLGATPIANLLGTDPENGVSGIDSFIIGSSVPNPLTEGTLYYCPTPGPSCTLSAVTANQKLTPAQAATIQFDPVSSYIGMLSFTYTVKDNNTTPLYSEPATYSLKVTNIRPTANPVVDAPVANTLVAPTLLAPLSGSDYDGTIVSYNITSVPASTDGTLQYCSTGTYPGCTLSTISAPITGLTAAQAATLTFTPNSGFTGIYAFEFTVVDNNNQVSEPAFHTIPITAFDVVTGEPPIAYSYHHAAVSSSTAVNLASALTGFDPDGGTITSYTITSTPTADQGTLTYCVTPGAGCATSPVTVGLNLTPAQRANLVFTPSSGYYGTVTFNYVSFDSDGNLSNSATVTIPVTNSAPVSTNIVNTAISRFGTAASLSTLSSSDADGTIANYVILSVPSADEGTLSVCTSAPSTGCTPVSVGQVLTAAQVAQLAFTPNVWNHNPTITFLYATTDNSGNFSNIASSTIPMFDAAPLPINLLNFNVKKNGRSANIDWKSGVEKAGVLYELQHSTNGQSWSVINTQKAHNNGMNDNAYSYIHPNLSVGVHYYRLKVSDLDNKWSFSPTKSITIDNNQVYNIVVFPNPVDDRFTISTSDASVMNEVSIYSNEGKLMQQFVQVNSGTEINLNNYASGFYIIKIKDKNGEMQVVKLTKK